MHTNLIDASLFLICLVCQSYSSDCPEPFKTRDESILDASVPVHFDRFYSAINITVQPNRESFARLFRFIPATAWINVTCNSSTSLSLLLNLASHVPKRNMLEEMLDLRNDLPTWSLWADRSVLIVSIYRLKISGMNDDCPEFKICPIRGMVTDQLLNSGNDPSSLCRPLFGEVSLTCLEKIPEFATYHLIFSVASGLFVMGTKFTSNLSRQNSIFNFVVSVGYRLPPGEFACPPGLLACPLSELQENPEPRYPWQQRLCIPMALRCDGTANCPGSDFDERDCAQPSITFPELAHERDSANAYLSTFSSEHLRLIGLNPLALARTSNASSVILFSLLCSIPVLLVGFGLAGWLIYKKSRRSSYTAVAQENGAEAYKKHVDLAHDADASILVADTVAKNSLILKHPSSQPLNESPCI